jgi:glycosidase
MAPDAASRNVAKQTADPNSVLAAYRRLVWLRRAHPALQLGAYRPLQCSRDVFAYVRTTESETIAVAVNFGREPGWAALGSHPGGTSWRTLMSTVEPMPDGTDAARRLPLRRLEAAVLVGV